MTKIFDKEKVLSPDLTEAKRFLNLLDEDTDTHVFQTFDDRKDRKDPSLTRVLIGTIEQHRAELCRLNQLGAGIFVTVNATDGTGRSKKNITRVRAIWQEQDRPGCPELPIEPHITVESSPEKHHRHVLLDGCPIEAFQGFQDRLVQDYGSDPSAADLSRVLRLPGFYHTKNPERPHKVRIVAQSNALPISYEEAVKLFPPVVRQPKAPPAPGRPIADKDEIMAALSVLNPDMGYSEWLSVGMALHDHTGGSADALAMWDTWSSNGAKHKEGDCTYRWESFDSVRDKIVTIKTVFKMANATGWRWTGEDWQQADQGNTGEQQQSTQHSFDPAKILEAFEVKRQYVDRLGKEEFLSPNLLIRQHILVVVALSGAGKTAYFYRHVAPELAGRGLTVWYCDADSPPSEHKAMKEIADLHGFKFINADANEGTSIDGLKTALHQIADSNSDLTNWVFIFDTLKKFADLMLKSAVKEFFVLCRRLTSKGASVVLLAHANKYRSPEGHLTWVFTL